MGRGTGGNGGQEKLVDSCRPMRFCRRIYQEPGLLLRLFSSVQCTRYAVIFSHQRINDVQQLTNLHHLTDLLFCIKLLFIISVLSLSLERKKNNLNFITHRTEFNAVHGSYVCVWWEIRQFCIS